MILRIVHAAVPPEKRESYVDFITNKLAPAVRKMPGCHFIYVAECVEKTHEHEIIYVSGWDSEEQCEALEKTNVYQGAASMAKTFYTHRYHDGALHIHYETIAALP
jgi:heme-degrading monooxygenase HmoA